MEREGHPKCVVPSPLGFTPAPPPRTVSPGSGQEEGSSANVKSLFKVSAPLLRLLQGRPPLGGFYSPEDRIEKACQLRGPNGTPITVVWVDPEPTSLGFRRHMLNPSDPEEAPPTQPGFLGAPAGASHILLQAHGTPLPAV